MKISSMVTATMSGSVALAGVGDSSCSAAVPAAKYRYCQNLCEGEASPA